MGRVYLVGTADTKGPEIGFLHGLLAPHLPGLIRVDLGSGLSGVPVDLTAPMIAANHPDGPEFLSSGDRGKVVAGMVVAFAAHCAAHVGQIDGIIGIGGGGGTAMVTAGMRALPLGVPKLMVSTLASGDVAPYVDISDIIMMPSVTDIAGLNRISRVILHNAAQAFRGMLAVRPQPDLADKPALGLTMFGVTTPAVAAIAAALQDRFDPLIFHATGTGGRAMEALADQGLLAGLIDITTTEIADLLFGGVLPALPTRLDVVARRGLPYVGSLGALDMVNFWAPDTVPAHNANRLLYHHNPNVTLMRTTVAECAQIGRWIGAKLNACQGPVRMLLPLGGLSALDIPGGAFHDPDADAALFRALTQTTVQTSARQLIPVPFHINDAGFAAAAVAAVHEIM